MAYKFQRGKAALSGTLVVDGELTGSGNVLLGSYIDSSSSVRGVLDLEDADGASYGLQLGGTLVTSTGTELNLLDGATAGVKVASKAAVYSSSGSLNTWGLTVVDGAYNLTVASHDAASNGLVLGSTLVTADASELNKLDGVTATTAELNYIDVTAGTAAASKALVLNAKRDITNILNITASFFKGDGSAITGVTAEAEVSGSDLTRGYLWAGNGDGDAMELEALDDGQILVGDGTDVRSVAVSGDVTLSNAGAVTIADNAVETDMIKNNAVTMASMATGSLQNNAYATGSIEVNHIKQAAVTMAAIATGSVKNNAYATGSIEVNHIKQAAVTMAAIATGSVETNAYKTGSIESAHIKDSTIANGKLAGGITGAKMNNAIFADLEIGAPSADGEVIVATGAGAFAYESGATLRTSLGLGTGDDVTFTDLTATGDATLGDGGEDTVTINAGHLGISNGIGFTNIKYKGENYTVSAGDYLIDAAGGFTMTLPAVSGVESGTLFVIKNGNGDATVANPVTIDGNSSEKIDGELTIKLESSYAAVTVMASGSSWLVL